jgi:hypothetical protein
MVSPHQMQSFILIDRPEPKITFWLPKQPEETRRFAELRGYRALIGHPHAIKGHQDLWNDLRIDFSKTALFFPDIRLDL